MTLSKQEEARILAAGEAAYADSQKDDDGLPVDPASFTMPNLAKSKIVHVRVNDREHADLLALAESKGIRISDVVRAAVQRHLQSEDAETRAEVEGLLSALRDRGLRLSHVQE